MELKISRIKPQEKIKPVTDVQNPAEQEEWKEKPRETVTYPNGISLHRQGDRYFVSVGEQEVMITEEEVMLIAKNHDCAYEIIIDKTRKFWFNASRDDLNGLKESI